jgi:hypothetical protein
MTKRADEFEELLGRTLHGHMNTAAPAGMTARIADAAGRQPVAVASKTRTPLWRLAVAAGIVLAAGISFFGWRHGQHVDLAPQTASNHAMVPNAIVPTTGDIAPANVSLVHRPEVKAAPRLHLTPRPHLPAAEAVEAENRPKLDIFPSTAIHPPKPEPGSMEAQLRILMSLPQSTLEEIADAQAKSRLVSAEQAKPTPESKLN